MGRNSECLAESMNFLSPQSCRIDPRYASRGDGLNQRLPMLSQGFIRAYQGNLNMSELRCGL